MNRTRRVAGGLLVLVSGLLALFAWIGATVLAGRPAVRYLADVSPQARFTFSTETDELLKQVRDRELEIAIDSFYQPLSALPIRTVEDEQFINMHRRIQRLTTDLLRVYEARGKGAVKVRHYDALREVKTLRDRRDELRARRENSIVVSVGKRRRELVLHEDLAEIDYPDQPHAQLPGAQRKFARLDTYKGEEAISSTIRSLLVEGTPVVYFLNGYSTTSIRKGVADSYSELTGALADDGFDVRELDLRKAGAIPEEASVVALLEPVRELTDRDAEALFAYLRRGGRMFLNVSYREQPVDYNPRFRRLGELLGFELGGELVAHLVKDPRFPDQPGRAGIESQNIDVNVNPHHPITKPLAQQGRAPQIKIAREFRRPEQPPEGVHVDLSLFQTGPWAWLAPRLPNGTTDFSAPRSRSDVATRSVGGIIDVNPEVGTRQGHLVLLGGAAFLNEGGFQFNGDLALNIFNWLAARKELVTVRGNRYESRRLEVTEAQVDDVRALLVWWVPLGLLGVACIVFYLRRRE